MFPSKIRADETLKTPPRAAAHFLPRRPDMSTPAPHHFGQPEAATSARPPLSSTHALPPHPAGLSLSPRTSQQKQALPDPSGCRTWRSPHNPNPLTPRNRNSPRTHPRARGRTRTAGAPTPWGSCSGRPRWRGSTATQRRSSTKGISEGGVDVASRCHPAGSGVVVGSGSPVDSLERWKVACGHANDGARRLVRSGKRDLRGEGEGESDVSR